MNIEQRAEGFVIVDGGGNVVAGPYSSREQAITAADIAGVKVENRAEFEPEAASLSDSFPVVQGTDRKWYIVNTSGGTVGGPYDTQSQATGARNAGRNAGNRFVPGSLPGGGTSETGEPGSITPPSLEGSAGLAERIVQGERGEWYVTNYAGETLAGPISTKEAAEQQLERIQRGIQEPQTARTNESVTGTSGSSSAPGPSSGGSGSSSGAGDAPALTLEQQQAQNRSERESQQQEMVNQAQAYAAANPDFVARGTRVENVRNGLSYEMSYSKQFGYELKPVQGNVTPGFDPTGTGAVRAQGVQQTDPANAARLATGGIREMITELRAQGIDPTIQNIGAYLGTSYRPSANPAIGRNQAVQEALPGRIYQRNVTGGPNNIPENLAAAGIDLPPHRVEALQGEKTLLQGGDPTSDNLATRAGGFFGPDGFQRFNPLSIEERAAFDQVGNGTIETENGELVKRVYSPSFGDGADASRTEALSFADLQDIRNRSQEGDPEYEAAAQARRADAISAAQGQGYSVVPGPGGWMILGPDGQPAGSATYTTQEQAWSYLQTQFLRRNSLQADAFRNSQKEAFNLGPRNVHGNVSVAPRGDQTSEEFRNREPESSGPRRPRRRPRNPAPEPTPGPTPGPTTPPNYGGGPVIYQDPNKILQGTRI